MFMEGCFNALIEKCLYTQKRVTVSVRFIYIFYSHKPLQVTIWYRDVMKQYIQYLHNKYEILAWSTHTVIYLFN